MLSGIKPYFLKLAEKLSGGEEAVFFSFSEMEGDPFRSILLLLLLGQARAYPACHLHLSIEQNRFSDRLPSVSSSIVDRRGAEGNPRAHDIIQEERIPSPDPTVALISREEGRKLRALYTVRWT